MGVVVVSILQFVGAGIFFLGAAGLGLLFSSGGIAVVLVIFGLLEIYAGYGMLKGMPHARSVAMVFSVIGIVLSFVDIIGFVIFLPALWYLTRPNVKAYFGEITRAYMKAPPPPPPPSSDYSIPQSSSAISPRNCPSCGSPMSYVAGIQRYWCPNDKKYFS
jgi:hypothetical protein